jgi:hypothetical protein
VSTKNDLYASYLLAGRCGEATTASRLTNPALLLINESIIWGETSGGMDAACYNTFWAK